MTKLEAVNVVLGGVGLPPITALDTGGSSAAGIAERIIDEEEKRIQSKGWHYNTRYNVELTPDGSKHILLPTGAMKIDSDAINANIDVSQIGSRLYNIDDNTDEFSSSIRATYVLRFEFTCIPLPVRMHIADSAAALYNERYGFQTRQRSLDKRMESSRREAVRFNSLAENINLNQTADAVRALGYRFPSTTNPTA